MIPAVDAPMIPAMDGKSCTMKMILLLGVLLAHSAVAQPAPPASPPAAPKLTGAQKIALRIEALREEDRRAKPPGGGVLFIGSSSIQLWPALAADFPEYRTINRGISGCGVSHVLEHVDEFVVPYRPKAIVCYVGENDIASGKTPRETAEQISRLFGAIREKLGKVPIIYIGAKPCPFREKIMPAMREYNRLVEEMAQKDPHIRYLGVWDPFLNAEGRPDPKLFKDGVHFNAEGYAIWTARLGPLLKSVAAP